MSKFVTKSERRHWARNSLKYCGRGFTVNSLGTTQRLVHDAVVEFVPITPWSSGPMRGVEATGEARFFTYEVVLPSDASMREIPGKPLPRPRKTATAAAKGQMKNPAVQEKGNPGGGSKGARAPPEQRFVSRENI